MTTSASAISPDSNIFEQLTDDVARTCLDLLAIGGGLPITERSVSKILGVVVAATAGGGGGAAGAAGTADTADTADTVGIVIGVVVIVVVVVVVIVIIVVFVAVFPLAAVILSLF